MLGEIPNVSSIAASDKDVSLELVNQSESAAFYIPKSLSDRGRKKERRNVISVVGNLVKSEDPVSLLRTINDDRRKRAESPLPISVHLILKSSESFDKLLDMSEVDLEGFFAVTPTLSKRDEVREKDFKGKRNFKSRVEEKTVKKEKREADKKNYREKKSILATRRYDGESSFYFEGSIEQMERKAKADAKKLARSEERYAPDTGARDRITAKRLAKAKKSHKDIDVTLKFFGESSPPSPLKRDGEKLETIDSPLPSPGNADDLDIKSVEDSKSDLPKVVTVNMTSGKNKVNSLGYTKEEVAVFRKNKLDTKRGKRAERINRRIEAKKVKEITPAYSSIDSVDEAFSGSVSVTKKNKDIVGLSTESGSLCPMGMILETLDSPTRSFVVFLYQCYRSSNVFDYAAAAHQYVATLGLVENDYIKDAISSLISSCSEYLDCWKTPLPLDDQKDDLKDVMDLKTESGYLDGFSTMFRSLMDGDLMVGLKNFFLTLAGMRLLGKQLDRNVLFFFGSFASKLSVIEFIEKLLDSVKSLVRFGTALVSGVPWTEALLARDPVASACERVQYLLKTREYTYTGLPSAGRICLTDYIKELGDNMAILKHAQKGLSPVSSLRSTIKSLLLEAELVMAAKVNEVQSTTRTAPFGLVTVGSSGIGKGHLLQYWARVWSYVKRRKYCPTQVFARSATSQYWEGYLPFSHPIIHYSEVARFTKDFTARNGDSQIDEITSLIDTLRFFPDMAFSDKGKVAAIPELVLLDTNNDTLNAGTLYYSEVAYLRRFLFIVPTVLPKFRKEGSNSIDPAKSNAADGHILDRYSFDVYTYQPNLQDVATKRVIAEGVDLPHLTSLLISLFTKHIEVSEATKDRISEVDLVMSKEEAPGMAPFFKRGRGPDIFSLLQHDDVKEELYEDPVEDLKKFAAVIDHEKSCIDPVDTCDRGEMKYSPSDMTEYGDSAYPPGSLDDPQVEDTNSDGIFSVEKQKAILEDLQSKHAHKKYCEEKAIDDCGVETQAGVIEVYSFFVYWWIYLLDILQTGGNFLLSHFLAGLITEDTGRASFNPYRIALYVILYKLNLVGVLMFPLFLVHYGVILDRFFSLATTRVVVAIERRAGLATNALRNRLFNEIYNPFRTRLDRLTPYMRYIKFATALISLLAVYKAGKGIARMFKRKEDKTYFTESKTEEDEMIERFNLGYTPNVVKSKVKENVWVDRVDLSTRLQCPPAHTSGSKELSKCVNSNVRFCKVEHPDGRFGKTFILGVEGNMALINEHAFRDHDWIKLYVSTSTCHNGGTGWNQIKVKRIDCTKVTDDILLFSAFALRFSNITVHFHQQQPKGQFQAYVNDEKVFASFVNRRACADDQFVGKVVVSNPVVYNVTHFPGMCGMPIVGDFSNGSVVYGLHFAGSKNTDEAYGIAVTKDMVLSAISALRSMNVVLFEAASQTGFIQTQFLFDEEIDCKTQSEVVEVGARALPPLEDPGFKSITRFEQLDQIEYVGKLPGPILFQKQSNLRLTEIADDVYRFFTEDLKRDVEVFCKPVLAPYTKDGIWHSPHNINILKMAGNKKCLDTATLVDVKSQLVSRFIRMLENEGITKLSPVSVSEAINGVESDPYFRRINASTSGGFGFPGGKHVHIPFVEGSETLRTPTPELLSKIRRMIELYESGRSAHPIYSGRLKDEPRSQAKVSSCKTRMFYMQALDSLIVSRMYLAPFYTLLVKYGEIFCTAVGTNMFVDADKMYHRLGDFSEDILEGDYGGYDVMMPHGVGECVNAIILEVLRHFGYDEQQLTITRGILTDNLFPYVEVLKDIFCVPGLQPSGKYATAEDNSLRGLVLLMYAWQTMGFREDFFEKVLPYLYGDDVVASSRESDFNIITYAAFVESHYGMTFTSPDKKDVSQVFVTKDTMSFLKRMFKYDEIFGKVVGYLPTETFVKSLMWTIPSKVVSALDTVSSTCVSMCYEFAMYDSKNFDRFRSFLANAVAAKYDILAVHMLKRLPILEEVVRQTQDFDTDSPYLLGEDYSEDQDDESYLGFATQSGEVGRLARDRSIRSESLINRSTDEKEMTIMYDAILAHPKFDSVFRSGLPLRAALRDSVINAPDDYCALIQEYCDLKATFEYKNKKGLFPLLLFTESGDLHAGEVDMSTMDREGNFGDVMGEQETSSTAGKSMFPDIGQATVLDLDDFFGRPVEIAEFSLPVGADTNLEFKIWDLYTSKPSVRAKLRNYAFFSATLHVRVEISGMPFHYGRVLLSYQPYAVNNATLNQLKSMITINPTSFLPLYRNYLSQAPGSAVMDVKANKPAEMTIPFIATKPMYRLYNQSVSVLSAATAYSDMANAGKLIVTVLTPVLSTAPSPSYPLVQIYAWATDVKLGTSTGTVIEIQTESGDYDERDKGPIEKFSSSAAQVTAALSKVPYVAPLAKASNYIFMGMRSLASIYGYSKPVEHGEPSLVKMEPYQNGANVIGMDTAKRIVLDPKQELILDPRIAASETDDLVIAEIARRNSYLTTFTWDRAAAPLSAIWNSRVTPYLHTFATTGGVTYAQPTACAFAVAPFNVWNGKMVYRFEVVCSSFHRGKIAVIFDPNVAQWSIISADITTNKQFMVVVDIQETQCFEVCVNWAHPRYWCTTKSANFTLNYGNTLEVSNGQATNGFITVVPFTALQSNDDSNVQVNVYVRCEDLRVNYFSEIGIEERKILTESGNLEPDNPVTCFEINSTTGNLGMCSEFHYGEEPVSFRSLLKRYVTTEEFSSVDVGTDWNYGRIAILIRNFPKNPLPYGSVSAANPLLHLFGYLQYAYLGTKGGLRKRVRLVGRLTPYIGCQVKITNGGYSDSTTTGISVYNGELAKSTNVGTVTFIPHNNSGVEFEVPYYSQNLFNFCNPDDGVGSNNLNETIPSWNKLSKVEYDVSGSFSPFAVSIETAAGEDFNFMRYQGAPYFTTT